MITRHSSTAQNRGGTCKAWKNVKTVLAEFWDGFTAFLKYFGGFTVFGDPLQPPPDAPQENQKGNCSIAVPEPITGGSAELTSWFASHRMIDKYVKIHNGNSCLFHIAKESRALKDQHIEGNENQAVGSTSRKRHRFDQTFSENYCTFPLPETVFYLQ